MSKSRAAIVFICVILLFLVSACKKEETKQDLVEVSEEKEIAEEPSAVEIKEDEVPKQETYTLNLSLIEYELNKLLRPVNKIKFYDHLARIHSDDMARYGYVNYYDSKGRTLYGRYWEYSADYIKSTSISKSGRELFGRYIGVQFNASEGIGATQFKKGDTEDSIAKRLLDNVMKNKEVIPGESYLFSAFDKNIKNKKMNERGIGVSFDKEHNIFYVSIILFLDEDFSGCGTVGGRCCLSLSKPSCQNGYVCDYYGICNPKDIYKPLLSEEGQIIQAIITNTKYIPQSTSLELVEGIRQKCISMGKRFLDFTNSTKFAGDRASKVVDTGTSEEYVSLDVLDVFECEFIDAILACYKDYEEYSGKDLTLDTKGSHIYVTIKNLWSTKGEISGISRPTESSGCPRYLKDLNIDRYGKYWFG